MVRSISTALLLTACAAFGELLVLSGAPAHAAWDDPSLRCTTAYNCWKGPGWYAEDEGGIVAGPFARREECAYFVIDHDGPDELGCYEEPEQPKWDKK